MGVDTETFRARIGLHVQRSPGSVKVPHMSWTMGQACVGSLHVGIMLGLVIGMVVSPVIRPCFPRIPCKQIKGENTCLDLASQPPPLTTVQSSNTTLPVTRQRFRRGNSLALQPGNIFEVMSGDMDPDSFGLDLRQRSGSEKLRKMPRDSRLPSLSQDNHNPLEPRVETSPLDLSSRRSRTPHHEERSSSRSVDGQSAEDEDRRAGTWVGAEQEDMWRGLPRPAGDDHPPSMAPLRFSGSGLPVSSPAQYELALPLALTPRMPPVPGVPRDSLGRRAGKRPAPSSTQSTPHGLPPPPDFSERASSAPGGDRDNTDDDGDEAADSPPGKKARLFLCHVCNRPAETEEEFKSHMRQHYDYSCTMCNYTTNSKRRLEYHMKCHGTEDEKPQPKAARQRNSICQKCDLIFNSKEEFWDHRREIHISSDKLLACTECKFVTEYKHHLEYHVRNHMNFKPYRCGECNYSCVNKSCLNSHMKSHSSVHQFRCSDCSYFTKFSHSMTKHCQKHNHTPAVPLNPDGSVPDGVDIVETGLTTLQKPRAPRGPRRGAKGSRSSDDFFEHFPQEALMPDSMGPSMVPYQCSLPFGLSVSPWVPSLMLPGLQHQGPLPNRSLATATVTSQTLDTMQDNDGHQYSHCGFGEISWDDFEKYIDQAQKGVFEPPPSDRSKMATVGGSDGKGDSMLKQPASVVNLPPSFLPQQPGQPQSRDPRIPTDSENPCMLPFFDFGDEPIDALKKMIGRAGSSFATQLDGPLDLTKPKKPEAPLRADVPPLAKCVSPRYCPPFIHGRLLGEIAFPHRLERPSVPVTSGAPKAAGNLLERILFRSNSCPQVPSTPATTPTPSVRPSDTRKPRKGNPSKVVVLEDDSREDEVEEKKSPEPLLPPSAFKREEVGEEARSQETLPSCPELDFSHADLHVAPLARRASGVSSRPTCPTCPT